MLLQEHSSCLCHGENGKPFCLADLDLLACSKRSDSGERCEVRKAMKSRGGLGREVREPFLTPPPPSLLFFRAPFTSHQSPLSERLEQAIDLYACHILPVQIQLSGGLELKLKNFIHPRGPFFRRIKTTNVQNLH